MPIRKMSNLESEFLLAVERAELDKVKEFLDTKNFTRLNVNCRDPLDRNALIIGIDNKELEIIRLLLETDIKVGDALLYAIQENYVEAVELLLDHSKWPCFHNFRPWGGSVPACRRPVPVPAPAPAPPEDHEAASTATADDQEDQEDYCFFSCDMTPLMLAAQKNNLEIIKLLLDRGVAPIEDPHDPRCGCAGCCQARSSDCLKHSRARIDAYRALSSPSLMALSSADPLRTAFETSAKLENLAQLEPEYKEVYMRLRAQCQAFATKLLDYTRTSKELETLLDFNGHEHEQADCSSSDFESDSDSDSDLGPGDDERRHGGAVEGRPGATGAADDKRRGGGPSENALDCERGNTLAKLPAGPRRKRRRTSRLARLKLAIQCKQKTFCAHPNIQELLATMWYENLPGFRRMSVFNQTLQVLCIGLMFPFYSLAYLMAPKSQLGRYIKKPFIKFICHSASYITFITLLVLASQRITAFYSWWGLVGLFTNGAGHHGHGHGHGQHAGAAGLAAGGVGGGAPAPGESNFSSLYSQAISMEPPPLPSGGYSDDLQLSQLAAIYKQTMGQAGGSQAAGGSTARGLDSLSRIFEELPASCKKRGTSPSPIESVILVWVVSLIWAELKQIRTLGINYYRHDMWNLLDSVASSCYIGTIILRVISYVQSDEHTIHVAREHWNAYDPTLLSEGLFAMATIFSSLKLVYIFSVNPYLGPLQISLGRMIVDILRFSWIYMLVLFAFACGMNQLLWYYADLERHQCLNVTNYNLAQFYRAKQASSLNIMDGGDPALQDDNSSDPPVALDDSCKTWRHFSNVFESSQTLFWANFGLVDLENFDLTGIRQYTRFWALLMFGCYCFINVIVVLNLLIAMMNHSYVKISTHSDIEWKFARTRLWMSYFENGCTVPAPFNVVPSIKSTRYAFRRVCRHLRNADTGRRRKRSANEPTRGTYDKVIKSLVRRYLVDEQRQVEKKSALTAAKLERWSKLNVFSN